MVEKTHTSRRRQLPPWQDSSWSWSSHHQCLMPACMQVFKKITYFHTCNTSSLLLIQRVSQSSQVTVFHLLWQGLSVDCFFSVCLDIWSANWTGPVPLNCSGDKRNCGCATNTMDVSISPLERRLCSFSTASYHLCHSWHGQSSSLGKYPYWSSITPAATYMYVSEPPWSSCCNKIKTCKPNNQFYQFGMCYFRSGYGYLELFCMQGEFTAALQCWSLVFLFYTEPNKGDLFSWVSWDVVA